MTHLIAFETQFGIAIETFMARLATKNASSHFAFIGTFPSLMAKLFAAETFYRGVYIEVVPSSLLLQFRKHIVAILFLFWLILVRSCLNDLVVLIIFEVD